MKYTSQFLEKIDFSLLKKQKQTLIKVIEKTNKPKEKEHLEGVLTLIDELQTEAVDNHGYKESFVFKLSKK